MGEARADDPPGRPPDLAVARVEGRALARPEVRDDDGDRDRRPRDPEGGHGQASRPAASRDREPQPEARDHERDLLAARRGRDRAGCERHPALLVEEPERVEEEGGRERDRVELVQRQPADGGVEEVGQGEAERGPLRAEVLAREQEDRQRAQPDGERLRDEQQVGARPETPERCEDDEDRVDVRRQPRDLVSAQVRDRERTAVRGRPDGLDHVPEVESSRGERVVAEDRQRGETGRVRGRRRPEQRPGPQAARRSRSSRQRRPSTASLACVS